MKNSYVERLSFSGQFRVASRTAKLHKICAHLLLQHALNNCMHDIRQALFLGMRQLQQTPCGAIDFFTSVGVSRASRMSYADRQRTWLSILLSILKW